MKDYEMNVCCAVLIAEMSDTLMPQQPSCSVMDVTFITSGSTGTIPNNSLCAEKEGSSLQDYDVTSLGT